MRAYFAVKLGTLPYDPPLIDYSCGVVVEKLMGNLSKIKLTGGLVGRICTVVMVVGVAICAMAASTRNPYVVGAAIVSVLAFIFPILWRAMAIAEKDPGVALLDGAQLLKHQQMTLASKEKPEILVDISTQTQGRAIANVDRNPALPDPPVAEQLENNHKEI